jgi:hypothetical protein
VYRGATLWVPSQLLKSASLSGGVLRESNPGVSGLCRRGFGVFAAGSDREARAAKNHSVFRAGNERLKTFNEQWFGAVLPRGGWVCECADDTCLAHIEMASSQYEAIRQGEDRFFVAPSDEHVWPDVDRVIERNDGYWIVETTGKAQDAVKRADTRGIAEPLSFRT